jgi:hypothetical protein
MAKFRKKPVVVEASQWFKPGDHPAVICSEIPHVKTAGGPAPVHPGDWIITESDGRGHYPCRPDIFAATYEAC